MDDYERDANFIGIRSAITVAGIIGFWVFDKSWVWLILAAMASFGIASLIWYLVCITRETLELQREAAEEAARPAEFIRTGPHQFVREKEGENAKTTVIV